MKRELEASVSIRLGPVHAMLSSFGDVLHTLTLGLLILAVFS